MKKFLAFLVSLFMFGMLATSAFAIDYYDGVSLGVCSYVDRNNSQKVNLTVFFAFSMNANGSLNYVVEWSSSYYAVRTMVVGYTSANSVSATINSSTVGTNTDFILCPTSYLAPGAGATASPDFPGYFYAGRIHTWLMPKSYFRPGSNSFSANIEGNILNMNMIY
ncbi:MAG: hypothetical protein LBH05_04945 [Deferribacteraceae bacterium]|nr:hypothetical protein [Deferribacteraceae bacterium]